MITDRIGLHSVLLPLLIFCECGISEPLRIYSPFFLLIISRTRRTLVAIGKINISVAFRLHCFDFVDFQAPTQIDSDEGITEAAETVSTQTVTTTRTTLRSVISGYYLKVHKLPLLVVVMAQVDMIVAV